MWLESPSVCCLTLLWLVCLLLVLTAAVTALTACPLSEKVAMVRTPSGTYLSSTTKKKGNSVLEDAYDQSLSFVVVAANQPCALEPTILI